jgi:hypothetical protein
MLEDPGRRDEFNPVPQLGRNRCRVLKIYADNRLNFREKSDIIHDAKGYAVERRSI